MGNTLQDQIASTQNINKDNYLKGIADYIITNPGSPINWGTNQNVPNDFGLTYSSSITAYDLDIDKISRLNIKNTYALSYVEIVEAAKLNNISIGITVSQLISINIEQTGNSTVGSDTSFSFSILTQINSKPVTANLQCYVVAESYIAEVADSTDTSGEGSVTTQFPTSLVNDALLVVFARAPFDDRITSFGIYNFANSTQETTPSGTILSLSPLNHTLYFDESTGFPVDDVYVLTYSYDQAITSIADSKCTIPQLLDNSPIILVARGFNNADYSQEWTSYPQVPLNAGSTFEGSEKNIFTYLVTIDAVLYNVELSFGDVNY